MKKATIYIVFILLLCTAGLYSAEISDAKDSTKVRTVPPKEKGFDLIAIGGLGFGWGGGRDTWGYYIEKYAPTITLGLELPLARTHYVSFEMLFQEWIGKQRIVFTNFPERDSKFYSENYKKIGDETYTQLGVSLALKFYLMKKTSKFRISFQFGFMLSNFLRDSIGDTESGNLLFGLNAYYMIDENITLSLSNSFNFNLPNSIDILFDLGAFPNILSLNLNYKFKL